MKKEEMVSIIVPVYNVEKELERCVESLIAQTYRNLEIILVDDGSSDKSGEIIDQYGLEYPAIIKTIHQKNKGLSGARNSGLDIAMGDYISFIDSDDFVDREMIETMVNSIIDTEADIAVCGRFDDYPNRSIVRFNMDEQTVYTPNEVMGRILTWNKIDIAAWDKLYRKDLWSTIRFPEGYNNEDLCTLPSLIRNAKKIVHVGKPLYHYCHRENSITTTFNEKKIKDFYHAIREVEIAVDSYYSGIENELIYYKNHAYLSLLVMCSEISYKGNERDEAKAFLKNNWDNYYSIEKMSRKDKIVYLLIKTGLFKIVKNIKEKMKR